MFTLPVCQFSIHEPDGDLSNPWDISGAVYDSSYSITESVLITGLFFNATGTKLYAITNGNDTIYQYTLSTPWEISTATYDSKSYDILTNGGQSQAQDLFIDATGTKLYVTGRAPDEVTQHTLGTPWDISTATFDNITLSVTLETSITALFFDPTGEKLWICGQTNGVLYQYDLSTPWDISTAVYNATSFDLQPEDAQPQGIYFKPDGTMMWMGGTISVEVHQYSLSTPWDITSMVYDEVSKDVSSQGIDLKAINFGDDGNKMYTLESTNATISQWEL